MYKINFVIFGIFVILKFHVINSNTVLGVAQRSKAQLILSNTFAQIIVTKDEKSDCKCDISSKYIDIAQISRADAVNSSVDEILKKLHTTVDGNYNTIYEILNQSECNFPYIQRGLTNLQQTINDIIDIFSSPEKRNDADLLDAAVNIFVCAKDSMIADMRSASKELSQECADLFTKIRPAACNTGENVCFTVLNSLC